MQQFTTKDTENDVDLIFEARWRPLLERLEKQFEMPMDLDALLFLIGVQELGQGAWEFSKEEKVDLMHIAVATVLGSKGYYRKVGQDADGWPHFEPLKSLPTMNVTQQERFMQQAVLDYFDQRRNTGN